MWNKSSISELCVWIRMEAFNEFPHIDSSLKEVHWKSIGRVEGGEFTCLQGNNMFIHSKDLSHAWRKNPNHPPANTWCFQLHISLGKEEENCLGARWCDQKFLDGIKVVTGCLLYSRHIHYLIESWHMRLSQQVTSPCAIVGQNAYGMSCSSHWTSYSTEGWVTKPLSNLTFEKRFSLPG